jgi:hypothetical protein
MMKAFVAIAAALAIGACSVAFACGPDGKCVGKEKASCCMSKASAKKSCSVKHDAKEAKLDRNARATENAAQTATANEPAKADAQVVQPKADPKR